MGNPERGLGTISALRRLGRGLRRVGLAAAAVVALAACADRPAAPPPTLAAPDVLALYGFRQPVPRPQQDELVGTVETHVARKEDTLLDLAVDHDLGYLEIVAANPGVDPWLPPAGAPVVLPKARLLPSGPRRGIVINLPERRLYHFAGGWLVGSYPVGIGRDGLETPLGSTTIVRKQEAPAWRPTPQARREDPTLPAVVPAGPDNPLGSHALYLGWSNYLIHGTNRVYAIGRRASRGCIRLYPDDIVQLFEDAAVGTPVAVIDQPVKVAWQGGVLYIEAHPTRAQGRELEEKGRFRPVASPDVKQMVTAKAGEAAAGVDWAAVDRALEARSGVPVAITRPAVVATRS
jgi:L,D-transpeptidase ErfK/SrfK